MKTRDNPFFRPARYLGALIFALSAGPVLAAPLFWDGTTSTADADGGIGTWNTALTNWDTLGAAGSNFAWLAGSTAVFSGMIGVTFLGLFLTPVFYVLVMKLGKQPKPVTTDHA